MRYTHEKKATYTQKYTRKDIHTRSNIHTETIYTHEKNIYTKEKNGTEGHIDETPNVGGVARQNNRLSTSTLSADGAESRGESSSELYAKKESAGQGLT